MAQNCQINFNEPADAALLCRIVDIHNDFIYCLAIIIFFVISFWNFLLSFFGQKNDNFSNIDYKKIGDFFRGSSTLTYNEVLEII